MTAIITKNGAGVPPSEALQKGELAVDLDGLKLYTSTDGTDIVEVSAAAEAEAIEQNLELDIEDIGEGKINHNFWLKGIGRDNEYLPYPQFQYQAGEEYTTLLFDEGIFTYGLNVRDGDGNAVFEVKRGSSPVSSAKPIQAPDFLDADGNSIIGGGSDLPDITMDAVGTATQKITLPEGALFGAGEEKAVGVGHIYEMKSDWADDDYTYYFKREGLENIHGNTGENIFDNPFYWMVGDWGNFYWGGESMGSEFHSAGTSWIDDLEVDTVIIGEAFLDGQGQRVSYSDAQDKKAKIDAIRARAGFSVETREREFVEVPLVVYGKIQADDLVDADGNTLLGGSDFEMPEVIDGGTY